MYNGYNTPPQFSGNYNMMQFNEGYPNGYPSSAPQIIPGVNTPLEVNMSNGATINIPPSGQTGYAPGGMTPQMKFNPVTRTISPVAISNGFDPYNVQFGNPAYRDPNQGFSPYYPGSNPNPSVYNSFYMNYQQNAFNQMVQDSLYTENPTSGIDIRELIAQVALPDEVRRRIERQPQIIGTDYFGRPIYNNWNSIYQLNLQRQQEFEERRKQIQMRGVMLSKLAHGTFGEIIDEQSAMEFYDPVRSNDYNPYKVADFYNSPEIDASKKEKLQKCHDAYTFFRNAQQYEQYQDYWYKKKMDAFAKIDASRNELLGVKPGETPTLEDYAKNGYKVVYNDKIRLIKDQWRNGTTKYSRNNYRAGLSQIDNTPVPITSKDDEYVPIENMLKAVYDRNRRMSDFGILKSPDGQLTYTSEPACSSELEAHKHFLEAMQAKRNQNNLNLAGI